MTPAELIACDDLTPASWAERRQQVADWQSFLEVAEEPTRRSLHAARDRAPLLRTLQRTTDDPRLTGWLAHATNLVGGRVAEACVLWDEHLADCRALDRDDLLAAALGPAAKSLRQKGDVLAAEALAREGLSLQRRLGSPVAVGASAYWLGMGLAQRGEERESGELLDEALDLLAAAQDAQGAGVSEAFLAQRALWLGDPQATVLHAERALDHARLTASTGDTYGALKVIASAHRMRGDGLLGLGRLDEVEPAARLALDVAALADFTEEQLPAWLSLAALFLSRGDAESAREPLARAMELAERGPYALWLTDAHLLAFDVSRVLGNSESAARHLQRATNLATSQSYARGLAGVRSRS